MPKQWTPDELLLMARGYQTACVLTAAADLDLFSILGRQSLTTVEISRKLNADLRATTILLDAMAGLELLNKSENRYAAAAGVSEMLTANGPHSLLAMTQHQGNCMRRWTQLARVVQNGRPAGSAPSIRGEEGDKASFIEAMNNLSAPMAANLIGQIHPQPFRHLLDVGGASGSWTIAFLHKFAQATATLFDLPHVIPMAERRLTQAGLRDRVQLVAGDFMADRLPAGADLAWVSAIVHQNSRPQNRQLFGSVFEALAGGGQILIRDIVMDESHVLPTGGALFAVNMLVATEGGGTFTLAELREDLESAGFVSVAQLRQDDWMNSIVAAVKPGGGSK